MSTSTYVHDAVRIKVRDVQHLPETNSYSRKVLATDERGDRHEFILFADTAEALAMPGDILAAEEKAA